LRAVTLETRLWLRLPPTKRLKSSIPPAFSQLTIVEDGRE
jgi:hypothetical protein